MQCAACDREKGTKGGLVLVRNGAPAKLTAAQERDVIIASERPVGLSVRNVVPARVMSVTPDVGRAVLVELDIGRTATLLARITARASEELGLSADKQVWALIKAVSLRGHVFNVP